MAVDGILVKSLNNPSIQQRQIKGTVRDNNMPIPGASVFIEGTDIGTATDFNGNFVLDIPANATTLSVTYIGYKRADVNIEGKSEISIVLEEDTNTLNEIVVVGYGTEKRENITASNNTSGTSPSTIRFASPSANAVLPTPESPT